MGAMRTPLRK